MTLLFWRHVITGSTQRRGYRATAWIVIVGLTLCLLTTLAAADERVTVVGVALDQETREADRRLQDYLQRSAEIRFAPEELEYGQVIARLADWDPTAGIVIARSGRHESARGHAVSSEHRVDGRASLAW